MFRGMKRFLDLSAGMCLIENSDSCSAYSIIYIYSKYINYFLDLIFIQPTQPNSFNLCN